MFAFADNGDEEGYVSALNLDIAFKVSLQAERPYTLYVEKGIRLLYVFFSGFEDGASMIRSNDYHNNKIVADINSAEMLIFGVSIKILNVYVSKQRPLIK